ncbi:MAG: hypothetical protein LDL38_12945 [Flavobacterium piscis]|nr:hypothetical protein [Flavobacterium piscis]
MRRNKICFSLICFGVLSFIGSCGHCDCHCQNIFGWYFVRASNCPVELVTFINESGNISMFLIENGFIYDFIIKKETLLLSTENEVFELIYQKKEDEISKRSIIEFPKGMYYEIRIIGEVNDGVWLLCGLVEKTSDIEKELVFVRDQKVVKKISLESLIKLDKLVNKDEGYIIRSDNLGSTIYFILSPILFQKDKKVRCYLLNKDKDEWELFFERELGIVSPLVIYKGKVYELGTDLTFELPYYLKAEEERNLSSRNQWLREGDQFIFFELQFHKKGYYLVKKDYNLKKEERIEIKKKFSFLCKSSDNFFIYNVGELCKQEITFSF